MKLIWTQQNKAVGIFHGIYCTGRSKANHFWPKGITYTDKFLGIKDAYIHTHRDAHSRSFIHIYLWMNDSWYFNVNFTNKNSYHQSQYSKRWGSKCLVKAVPKTQHSTWIWRLGFKSGWCPGVNGKFLKTDPLCRALVPWMPFWNYVSDVDG